MASEYSAIDFVKPPGLLGLTKASLVKFKEELEVYKENARTSTRVDLSRKI